MSQSRPGGMASGPLDAPQYGNLELFLRISEREERSISDNCPSVVFTGSAHSPVALIVAVMFVIGGIPLLIYDAVICIRESSKEYVETQGGITGFGSGAETYVKYQVDGKTYKSTLSYKTSAMHSGQKISIQYDRADPYSIRKAGAFLWLGTVLSLFVPFGIIGIGAGVLLL